jgi:hypothetical protein
MTSDGEENSKHKMVFEKSGVDQRAPPSPNNLQYFYSMKGVHCMGPWDLHVFTLPMSTINHPKNTKQGMTHHFFVYNLP